MADCPLCTLHVHHTPMYGGAEASLLCLLRHLPQDVKPILACPPGGFLDKPGAAGRAQWVAVPTWDARWPLSPWAMLRELRGLHNLRRSLGAIVENFAPTVIHANSRPAAVAALWGTGLSAPVIWHARDLRMRGLVVRWLWRNCAAVIAISRAVRNLILADGCPPDRVHLVYNGVDLEEVRGERPPDEVRAELKVPQAAPLVVSVARLVPWKRHDLLLETALLVRQREPDARFVFVGGESPQHKGYRAKLQAEIDRLGLTQVVTLTGHRDDVANIVAAADVFVHAADTEPLGRAIMEAMALGKPVVVPKAAGPGELVEDGLSGLAVTPGSAEALADGVVRLLADPTLAAACGTGARQRIATHFGANKMATETVGVFRRVVEGDGP